MRHLLRIALLGLLPACGCEALGYRVEWSGFDPDPAAPAPEGTLLNAPRDIPLTAQTAWVTWKSRHDDLERSLRNLERGFPPPAGRIQACERALDTLARIYPDERSQHVLASARDGYDRIRAEASGSPVGWSLATCSGIEDELEALRR